MWVLYCRTICHRNVCPLNDNPADGKRNILKVLAFISIIGLVKLTLSVILWDFNVTWIFSTNFRKTLKCQISWESVRWEPSCSMRTDRQTWRSQYPFLAILLTRLSTSSICPRNTRYISQTALHAADNLLAALHNTAHSCSRHGVATALLPSERPGSVIPVSKTFTVLAVHS